MNELGKRKAQGMRLAGARLAAGFRSARAAAIEFEWPESTYRAHETGNRTIGQDDAERYASCFRSKGAQVTPEKILFGSEREQSATFEDEPFPTIETKVFNPAPRFLRAAYGGIVEAGTYRPVADFEDDPDREPHFYPRDSQFPNADLFVFDVAGDSMNALQPRPILPGDQLICVAIEQVRIPLRERMVVIVEQSINGGMLRERSVKQIVEFEDRFEFWPRSKNARHTPIVVPRDFKVDEGRTVSVVGIVRKILNGVPLE